MHNFSWVVSGKLAGAGLPQVFKGFELQCSALQYISEQEVEAILSLTEDPFLSEAIDQFGFKYLHVPIPDFTAPTMAQLSQCISFIDSNNSTVAHCWGGRGRTGTILAAYLISNGWHWTDAIERIRELRPGSIENDDQEDCLEEFWSTQNTTPDEDQVEISDQLREHTDIPNRL